MQYQQDAQYYPPASGYSGSILTPDMNMSYTQQAGDTNFDDEPPLLEGELCCSVFVRLSVLLIHFACLLLRYLLRSFL